MIKLWQVFLLIFIVALLVTGYYIYSQSPKPSRIVGDKLYLSESSVTARMYKQENINPPVYTRFDQNYPPNWPTGLTFPKDTFILDPPLELKPVRNEEMAAEGYKSFDARILIPFDNNATVRYLEQMAQESGFITEKHSTGKIASRIVNIPNYDEIVDIRINQGKSKYYGFFKVHFDHNMKGYTEVRVQILE